MDGTTVVTGGKDVRVYDRDSHTLIDVFDYDGLVAVHDNGVVVGNDRGDVRLIDLATKKTTVLGTGGGEVIAVSITQDKVMAVYESDGDEDHPCVDIWSRATTQLLDHADRACLREIRGFSAAIPCGGCDESEARGTAMAVDEIGMIYKGLDDGRVFIDIEQWSSLQYESEIVGLVAKGGYLAIMTKAGSLDVRRSDTLVRVLALDNTRPPLALSEGHVMYHTRFNDWVVKRFLYPGY